MTGLEATQQLGGQELS
uniref:Uncharacterized protein n=1 Tax=Rhizophora mucronata TaxID=61149 RepID=A0A2P2QT93_RHIMU